jgi:hypothetical protein
MVIVKLLPKNHWRISERIAYGPISEGVTGSEGGGGRLIRVGVGRSMTSEAKSSARSGDCNPDEKRHLTR